MGAAGAAPAQTSQCASAGRRTAAPPGSGLRGWDLFFVLRTGCQSEALNATGICPHSTAHDWFTEWVQAGVWQQLWAALLSEYGELHDWTGSG